MNETNVASLDASNELLQLQARVKWMDVLMRQNAALEGEVSRLCEELDEATRGVLKRGYLYKYRYPLLTAVLHFSNELSTVPTSGTSMHLFSLSALRIWVLSYLPNIANSSSWHIISLTAAEFCYSLFDTVCSGNLIMSHCK